MCTKKDRQPHLRKHTRTVMQSPLMMNKNSLFIHELNIDSLEPLKQLKRRSTCTKCQKSRMFFCYKCYIPVAEVEDVIPKVSLPIEIDVIKHPHELDGKSTGCHAQILAPDDAKIYTYPEIPNYNPKKVILMFPSDTSISIEKLCSQLKSPRKLDSDSCITSLEKVIFIDSTWTQAKKILADDRINCLPRIELKSRDSIFWRYQTGSPLTHLATIEAIYYFTRDYYCASTGKEYDGRFDNLLYFFKFFFDKIYRQYHPDDQNSDQTSEANV